MPLGVIQLAFDPVLRLSDTASVRYETIGIAVVLFLGLALAARIGSQTPSVGPYVPAPGLRVDDLVFCVVGAVPGAIVGGRAGAVLDHLDYYRANPGAIVDPNQGGLTLTLAIPFGIFTAAVIARLLGAPIARWLHAAALPLLFVLAAGKLMGVLGATGQGLPSDLPWATAYIGPGPWGSLAPGVASQPSQAYEAVLVTLALGGLLLASRLDVVARRDGAAMFVALGLWAVTRFIVGFTWRDSPILGPLRTEQLLALVVLAIAVVGFVERARAPLATVVERRPEAEARLA
ncbi:MAG TPA: prolipoprotein diacylglyceryl transferase family protein [Patescibacteria group bacterium]|nr:prolipoprotein diacylglyceryl transferase family protein [Patescibacteria group bacterium]